MAEAKKSAEKEEKKKTTSKKTATTPKKTNKTNKVAVSSKKDTAKVAPKKVETKKTKTTSKKSEKTNKETTSKKNITKGKKTKKEDALKALDEELLNKTTGPKTVKIVEKRTEKIEEEKKSVLEELVGTPKTEEEKVLEDNGIFSSKVIWYLFFILVLIIIAFLYVYNEDTTQKRKNNVISETEYVAEEIENVNNNSNKRPAFNMEDAERTIKSFFLLYASIDSDPTTYLKDCGLTKSDASSFKKSKDNNYYVTDVVYDNLSKYFESIVTRECFETVFASSYKQLSGATHSRIAVNPVNRFEINEIVQLDGTKPTLRVKYTVTPEKGEKVITTRVFEFELNKGKWIISKSTVIQ